MSADIVEALVGLYRSVVPQDMGRPDRPDGTDDAYVLAEMMAISECVNKNWIRMGLVSKADGFYLELHARQSGLFKQNGESDEALRARIQTPPLTITPDLIIQALQQIVDANSVLVGVPAFLDCSTITTHVDTVVRARVGGTAGNNISLAFVNDGTGTGSLTVSGRVVTMHYQSGVTVVGNFESLVAGATQDLIEIDVSGSTGVIMSHPGDTASPAFLSGGNGGFVALLELPRDSVYANRGCFLDRGYRIGGSSMLIALIPVSANARVAVLDSLRAKRAAGKLYAVEEYT